MHNILEQKQLWWNHKDKQELARDICAGFKCGFTPGKEPRNLLNSKPWIMTRGWWWSCSYTWSDLDPALSEVLGYSKIQPWKAGNPFLPFSLLTAAHSPYWSREHPLLAIFIENETRQSVQNIIWDICSTSPLTECMCDVTESKFQIAEFRYWVFLKWAFNNYWAF